MPAAEAIQNITNQTQDMCSGLLQSRTVQAIVSFICMLEALILASILNRWKAVPGKKHTQSASIDKAQMAGLRRPDASYRQNVPLSPLVRRKSLVTKQARFDLQRGCNAMLHLQIARVSQELVASSPLLRPPRLPVSRSSSASRLAFTFSGGMLLLLSQGLTIPCAMGDLLLDTGKLKVCYTGPSRIQTRKATCIQVHKGLLLMQLQKH